MTGRPLPAAPTITVSVLNGTGITGQAAATGPRSRRPRPGRRRAPETPRRSGAVSETTVTYSAGHEAAAERVAHDLSGSVAMGLGATAGGADVTVVTGTDFSVLTPQHAGRHVRHVGGGDPPPTSASTDSAILAPPTPPSQTLAPFDPRSCTASGGEGP